MEDKKVADLQELFKLVKRVAPRITYTILEDTHSFYVRCPTSSEFKTLMTFMGAIGGYFAFGGGDHRYAEVTIIDFDENWRHHSTRFV